MEQGYLGRGWLLMGPGLGWTLPLIRSKARIRRRRRGSSQLEEELPSCDRSTGSPAKKQSETMGATFWSSPSGDLSCHFDPFPLGRGLHHHDVAGRWCSNTRVAERTRCSLISERVRSLFGSRVGCISSTIIDFN